MGINCGYILYINLLSVASFENIFSHSIGCLFILLMVSFASQKLLCLIRSNLFIFAFICFSFGRLIKENITMIYVKDCFACVLF